MTHAAQVVGGHERHGCTLLTREHLGGPVPPRVLSAGMVSSAWAVPHAVEVREGPRQVVDAVFGHKGQKNVSGAEVTPSHRILSARNIGYSRAGFARAVAANWSGGFS